MKLTGNSYELEQIPLPANTKILAAHTAYSCPGTANHFYRFLHTSQLLQSKQTSAELEAFYESYDLLLFFVNDIDEDDYYGANGINAPLLRKYEFPDSVPVGKTWLLVVRREIYRSGYMICR